MNNFPLNFITFPLWWYTVGASIMWQWSKKHIRFSLQKTGLILFAHHISEPLYKDYSKSGRVLSFFLRLILIIYKSLIFAVKSLVILAADILFLALLPAVMIIIIFQVLPSK